MYRNISNIRNIMDFSFLKNPIVLAILAAVITYLYMYWQNKETQEKNPKAKPIPVDYTTPIIIGLMTLFITYCLFGFNGKKSDSVGDILEKGNTVQTGGNSVQILEPNSALIKTRLSDRMTDSFDSNTFHLVGKNSIKLPQTDVFIDIAKF